MRRLLAAVLARAVASRMGRDTGVLMLGVIIAQGIAVAAIPVVTRLVTAEEFGVFSSFAALVGLVAVFACLYFEAVIPLARDDREADAALALAIASTVLVTVICAVVVFAAGDALAEVLQSPQLGTSLWLFPLNVGLLGVFQACTYWLLRKQAFKMLSGARIAQSASIAGVQIGAGLSHTGAAGLIGGFVVGQLVATAAIAMKPARALLGTLAAPGAFGNVAACARRYASIAGFGSWGSLMVTASYQVVPLILSALHGPAAAGLYFLSYRVANLPVSLLGVPLGQVMLQRSAATLSGGGNISDLVEKTLATLMRLGLLPFLAVAVFAPLLFAFAFGAEWALAGEVFRYLAAPFFLQFVVAPVSAVMIALQKQRAVAQIQSAMFVGAVVSLVAGYLLFESIIGSVILYALTQAALYLVYLAVILHCSSASGRRIAIMAMRGL